MESCRNLWRELTEWHREIYADKNIGSPTPEDFFDKHIAKVGPAQIWVAETGSKVVGFASLIGEEEITLEPVVVSKPFRRKGAGRLLVQRAVEEAKSLGARHLNVAPVARNSCAFLFYHSLGFVNVGNVQLFLDFSGKKWRSSLTLHELDFNY